MDRPVPDHRGPELPALVAEIRSGLRQVFQTTRGEIILYPGSGTGAWEASLANTVSPGERVLAFHSGYFSHLYAECARRLGAAVDEIDLPWEGGIPPQVVHDRLVADRARAYKAVLVVHNETSTGVASDLQAIRSIDFRCCEWDVDVALTGPQKGLMLPPGMAILCAGPRAIEVSAKVTTPRYFFDWAPVLEEMRRGYFPYTPATLMLYGLREAVRMLLEEGLPAVFDRHRRLAEGIRRAVAASGLSILCRDPALRSNSLTAVVVPEGKDSAGVLQAAERLHLSLGTGLGRLRGRVFRIGHLGSFNELEAVATVAGVEMACAMAGIQVNLGAGPAACQRYFMERHIAAATTSGHPSH